MRFLPFLPCLVLVAACGAAADTVRTPPAVATAGAPTGLDAHERDALRHAGVEASALRCNSRNMWNPVLRAEAKATAAGILQGLADLGLAVPVEQADAARRLVTDAVMWRMVLSTLVDGDFHNLGVVPVRGRTTADGRPLLLFRSGFTPAPAAPGSCFDSLVRAAGVRHTVNLYAGAMPTASLEAGERQAVTAAGGTYLSARDPGSDIGSWREDLRADAGRAGTSAPDATAAKRAAMAAVARIVRDLLQPGGQTPRGHLHVHCGGGMHRTGMVVGIVERCVNGADPAAVAAAYKRHVAWRSDAEPGGFEPENLHFIETFDCQLLQPAP